MCLPHISQPVVSVVSVRECRGVQYIHFPGLVCVVFMSAFPVPWLGLQLPRPGSPHLLSSRAPVWPTRALHSRRPSDTARPAAAGPAWEF
jgi:hypothetical protein